MSLKNVSSVFTGDLLSCRVPVVLMRSLIRTSVSSSGSSTALSRNISRPSISEFALQTLHSHLLEITSAAATKKQQGPSILQTTQNTACYYHVIMCRSRNYSLIQSLSLILCHYLPLVFYCQRVGLCIQESICQAFFSIFKQTSHFCLYQSMIVW